MPSSPGLYLVDPEFNTKHWLSCRRVGQFIYKPMECLEITRDYPPVAAQSPSLKINLPLLFSKKRVPRCQLYRFCRVPIDCDSMSVIHCPPLKSVLFSKQALQGHVWNLLLFCTRRLERSKPLFCAPSYLPDSNCRPGSRSPWTERGLQACFGRYISSNRPIHRPDWEWPVSIRSQLVTSPWDSAASPT